MPVLPSRTSPRCSWSEGRRVSHWSPRWPPNDSVCGSSHATNRRGSSHSVLHGWPHCGSSPHDRVGQSRPPHLLPRPLMPRPRPRCRTHHRHRWHRPHLRPLTTPGWSHSRCHNRPIASAPAWRRVRPPQCRRPQPPPRTELHRGARRRRPTPRLPTHRRPWTNRGPRHRPPSRRHRGARQVRQPTPTRSHGPPPLHRRHPRRARPRRPRHPAPLWLRHHRHPLLPSPSLGASPSGRHRASWLPTSMPSSSPVSAGWCVASIHAAVNHDGSSHSARPVGAHRHSPRMPSWSARPTARCSCSIAQPAQCAGA